MQFSSRSTVAGVDLMAEPRLHEFPAQELERQHEPTQKKEPTPEASKFCPLTSQNQPLFAYSPIEALILGLRARATTEHNVIQARTTRLTQNKGEKWKKKI